MHYESFMREFKPKIRSANLETTKIVISDGIIVTIQQLLYKTISTYNR